MGNVHHVDAVTEASMMSESPLPWPVTPYDECKLEREAIAMAEAAAYDARQYEMYGDDEEYMRDMMCSETEVDLRVALWRADRMEQLGLELRRFFELVDLRCFEDALYVGWWLLEQHDKYGACFDSVLLQLLKRTIAEAFQANSINSSGESVEASIFEES